MEQFCIFDATEKHLLVCSQVCVLCNQDLRSLEYTCFIPYTSTLGNITTIISTEDERDGAGIFSSTRAYTPIIIVCVSKSEKLGQLFKSTILTVVVMVEVSKEMQVNKDGINSAHHLSWRRICGRPGK